MAFDKARTGEPSLGIIAVRIRLKPVLDRDNAAQADADIPEVRRCAVRQVCVANDEIDHGGGFPPNRRSRPMASYQRCRAGKSRGRPSRAGRSSVLIAPAHFRRRIAHRNRRNQKIVASLRRPEPQPASYRPAWVLP